MSEKLMHNQNNNMQDIRWGTLTPYTYTYTYSYTYTYTYTYIYSYTLTYIHLVKGGKMMLKMTQFLQLQ